MTGHPLGAQHGGLDFVGGQHQRRQIEPGLRHVTDPGLTADRDPLTDQIGDVAIDRPPGGIDLGCECVGFSRQVLQSRARPLQHRRASLDRDRTAPSREGGSGWRVGKIRRVVLVQASQTQVISRLTLPGVGGPLRADSCLSPDEETPTRRGR